MVSIKNEQFNPIAIIGHACLFPGALSSTSLWEKIISKTNCLVDATKEHWRTDPKHLISMHARDLTWTATSGFIQGFDKIFNPNNFHLSPEFILQQDILLQWLLHVGRETLQDANLTLSDMSNYKCGAIIGNLSYPTASLEKYAEIEWLLKQTQINESLKNKLRSSKPHAINRFMSGLPIQLMAKALGLTELSFAIDAACASSLYALKLACDFLQNHKADLMIAGGVNAADGLILNVGFAKFQALSKSGKSRPFHKEADGIIPSQGVGLVLLKRLEDAIRDKNIIQGVIRGIGLSNDGKSSGFLFPSESGQVAAMQEAYINSGIDPSEISWVECHATGTSIGDRTELKSMHQIFGVQQELTLGALKANIGHPITAAGIASIINVIHAFKAGLMPPVRESSEQPISELIESNFRILHKEEPWISKNGKRVTAINCFGFGGTNAHLILEEFSTPPKTIIQNNIISSSTPKKEAIAIVGISVLAGGISNLDQFRKMLISTDSPERFLEKLDLPIRSTRFPPNDLKVTLGQQLTILKVAQDLYGEVKNCNPERTSVIIGMGCDTDLTPYGIGPRINDLTHISDLINVEPSNWFQEIRETYISRFNMARSIGALPNITANRLNQQFDFKKQSYTVSAEEASGLVAIHIALNDLRAQEVDLALVGAVDLSCDFVHQQACIEYLPEAYHVPGDAAVIIALKRLEDAKKDGDIVFALINEEHEMYEDSISVDLLTSPITRKLGHAHAASSLLHVAASAVACHEKINLDRAGVWEVKNNKRVAKIGVQMLQQELSIYCHEV